MSRYNYCDTTDRIYFKKDAKKAKELIISEDACDRLNDLERQLEEARELVEDAISEIVVSSSDESEYTVLELYERLEQLEEQSE